MPKTRSINVKLKKPGTEAGSQILQSANDIADFKLGCLALVPHISSMVAGDKTPAKKNAALAWTSANQATGAIPFLVTALVLSAALIAIAGKQTQEAHDKAVAEAKQLQDRLIEGGTKHSLLYTEDKSEEDHLADQKELPLEVQRLIETLKSKYKRIEMVIDPDGLVSYNMLPKETYTPKKRTFGENFKAYIERQIANPLELAWNSSMRTKGQFFWVSICLAISLLLGSTSVSNPVGAILMQYVIPSILAAAYLADKMYEFIKKKPLMKNRAFKGLVALCFEPLFDEPRKTIAFHVATFGIVLGLRYVAGFCVLLLPCAIYAIWDWINGVPLGDPEERAIQKAFAAFHEQSADLESDAAPLLGLEAKGAPNQEELDVPIALQHIVDADVEALHQAMFRGALSQVKAQTEAIQIARLIYKSESSALPREEHGEAKGGSAAQVQKATPIEQDELEKHLGIDKLKNEGGRDWGRAALWVLGAAFFATLGVFGLGQGGISLFGGIHVNGESILGHPLLALSLVVMLAPVFLWYVYKKSFEWSENGALYEDTAAKRKELCKKVNELNEKLHDLENGHFQKLDKAIEEENEVIRNRQAEYYDQASRFRKVGLRLGLTDYPEEMRLKSRSDYVTLPEAVSRFIPSHEPKRTTLGTLNTIFTFACFLQLGLFFGRIFTLKFLLIPTALVFVAALPWTWPAVLAFVIGVAIVFAVLRHYHAHYSESQETAKKALENISDTLGQVEAGIAQLEKMQNEIIDEIHNQAEAAEAVVPNSSSLSVAKAVVPSSNSKILVDSDILVMSDEDELGESKSTEKLETKEEKGSSKPKQPHEGGRINASSHLNPRLSFLHREDKGRAETSLDSPSDGADLPDDLMGFPRSDAQRDLGLPKSIPESKSDLGH